MTQPRERKTILLIALMAVALGSIVYWAAVWLGAPEPTPRILVIITPLSVWLLGQLFTRPDLKLTKAFMIACVIFFPCFLYAILWATSTWLLNRH
jgi:hypothetical protein